MWAPGRDSNPGLLCIIQTPCLATRCCIPGIPGPDIGGIIAGAGREGIVAEGHSALCLASTRCSSYLAFLGPTLVGHSWSWLRMSHRHRWGPFAMPRLNKMLLRTWHSWARHWWDYSWSWPRRRHRHRRGPFWAMPRLNKMLAYLAFLGPTLVGS